MQARHVFDIRVRYPISSDASGVVITPHERGGVDKVQAIQWWAHLIYG